MSGCMLISDLWLRLRVHRYAGVADRKSNRDQARAASNCKGGRALAADWRPVKDSRLVYIT